VDAGQTCNLIAKLTEDTLWMLVYEDVCTAKQIAKIFPVKSVVYAGQTCNLIAQLIEDAL